MANKYLDQAGVQYLWGKIKAEDDKTLLAATKASKEYVDGLLSLTDEDNAVVNKIAEVLEVFENYDEGKNLLDFINSKLDKAGGEISGDIIPNENTTYDLGSSTKRFNFIYTDELDASAGINAGSTIKSFESLEVWNKTTSGGQERIVYLSTDGISTTGTISEGGQLLSNKYVTLSTLQTISGTKTFTGPVNIDWDLQLQNTSSSDLLEGTKTAYIHVYDKTAQEEYKVEFRQQEGIVALLSDIPTNYVTTDTVQTISGFKTFTGKTRFNQTVEIASNLTLESIEGSEYGYSGKVKAVNLYDPTSESEYRVEIPFRDGLVALASDLAIALTTTDIDAATA